MCTYRPTPHGSTSHPCYCGQHLASMLSALLSRKGHIGNPPCSWSLLWLFYPCGYMRAQTTQNPAECAVCCLQTWSIIEACSVGGAQSSVFLLSCSPVAFLQGSWPVPGCAPYKSAASAFVKSGASSDVQDGPWEEDTGKGEGLAGPAGSSHGHRQPRLPRSDCKTSRGPSPAQP